MSPTSAKNASEDHGAGDAATSSPAAANLVGNQDPFAIGRASTRPQHITAQSPAPEIPSQPSALQAVGNFFGIASPDPAAELKTKYRKLKTENQELQAENQSLWGRNQALKSQSEQWFKALELKEREHAIKLDEKRAQLEQKDAELAELRRTLCMYDDCSEADITKMVEAINTKIQSVSRNLAGRWIKEASNPADGGVDAERVTDEEAANLSGIVGAQLFNALYNSTPGQTKYASLFLQVAWKASIVATVTKIMSSFSARLSCTPGGQHVDTTLRSISDRVMDGEIQPAYGRWRLITHRYLGQVLSDEEQAIQFYGNEALGYCLIASRLIMKNRCPDAHVFATTLDPKMREIMADALKLRTIFQEQLTTTNFEPYTPEKGSLFLTERMEVGKQDKVFENDRAVCITGLGLLRWGKMEGINVLTIGPVVAQSTPTSAVGVPFQSRKMTLTQVRWCLRSPTTS